MSLEPFNLIKRWHVRGPRKGSVTARQARGRRGEQLARAWLEREGFIIEASNVRFPVGEVDLIAREGQTLCFVEVRGRASQAYGGPLESVDHRKRRRVIRAARWYLSRRPTEAERPPRSAFRDQARHRPAEGGVVGAGSAVDRRSTADRAGHRAVRFDVVSIAWRTNGAPVVELIRGAFDASEDIGATVG